MNFTLLFEKIGRQTKFVIQGYGQLSIMLFYAFSSIRKFHLYFGQIIERFIYIGRRSLPIVIITSIFIGLALGVQIGTQMSPVTPSWMEGGLIEPDGGTIEIDGIDATGFDEEEFNKFIRPKMALVFQEGALWDSMTAVDNIDLALQIQKHLGVVERKNRINEKRFSLS